MREKDRILKKYQKVIDDIKRDYNLDKVIDHTGKELTPEIMLKRSNTVIDESKLVRRIRSSAG